MLIHRVICKWAVSWPHGHPRRSPASHPGHRGRRPPRHCPPTRAPIRPGPSESGPLVANDTTPVTQQQGMTATRGAGRTPQAPGTRMSPSVLPMHPAPLLSLVRLTYCPGLLHTAAQPAAQKTDVSLGFRRKSPQKGSPCSQSDPLRGLGEGTFSAVRLPPSPRESEVNPRCLSPACGTSPVLPPAGQEVKTSCPSGAWRAHCCSRRRARCTIPAGPFPMQLTGVALATQVTQASGVQFHNPPSACWIVFTTLSRLLPSPLTPSLTPSSPAHSPWSPPTVPCLGGIFPLIPLPLHPGPDLPL